MGELHTDQFDLSLIALDCCGDHPFADVLCLYDLSPPSLVHEYANSVLLSEAISAHIYIYVHISIPRSLCFLVSMFRAMFPHKLLSGRVG